MKSTVSEKPEDTWSTRLINSQAHSMENFLLSSFALGSERAPENSGCKRDDTTQQNPCIVTNTEPVSCQWGFAPEEAHVPLGVVCKDNFILKSKNLDCQALSLANLGPYPKATELSEFQLIDFRGLWIRRSWSMQDLERELKKSV